MKLNGFHVKESHSAYRRENASMIFDFGDKTD
jgi:hypothetical protein